MITRRKFLEKSGLTVGMFLGAETVLVLSDTLSAQDLPVNTIRTGLTIIDNKSLSRVLKEIDTFGSREQYRKLGSGSFNKGMDILRYIDNFLKQVKARYPVTVSKKSRIQVPLKEIGNISRGNDACLALLSSLVILMGDQAFQTEAENLEGTFSWQKSERFGKNIDAMLGALKKIEKQWKIGGASFLESGYGMGPVGRINLSFGEYSYGVEFRPLKIDELSKDLRRIKEGLVFGANRILYKMNRFCYEFPRAISLERARWKKYHTKYLLFSQFEGYKRSMGNNKKEAVNSSNEIAEGKKTFFHKVLLGYLFAEISAARIALLAYQASSGVFTNGDKSLLAMEIEGLYEFIAIIVEECTFGKQPLFTEKYYKKPAVVQQGGERLEFTIQPFTVMKLPAARKDAFFTYTTELMLQIKESAESFIKSIRRGRENIIRGLEKL
ncbi:MAG: hypothetical protein GY754_28700 [bacterium]|nr:hypothetical protein [bacterium]